MFDPRREERNDLSIKPRNYTYGHPYFGSKIRKETQNYENYMKWNGGGVEFRPNVKEDDHGNGIYSPPLWEKQSGVDDSLNLSPASRREAVNRGRLELMEMVKAMPESSYELSLKDLVDHFHQPEENIGEEQKKIKRKAKMGRSVSSSMRNGNGDNKGLFLKMVLPLPFGGSKKKKVINPYARVVSTKQPSPACMTEDTDDKQWWKKRSSVSDESQSGGSTGSRGSSHSSESTRTHSPRNKNGCLHGFSAFYLKKSKSTK